MVNNIRIIFTRLKNQNTEPNIVSCKFLRNVILQNIIRIFEFVDYNTIKVILHNGNDNVLPTVSPNFEHMYICIKTFLMITPTVAGTVSRLF